MSFSDVDEVVDKVDTRRPTKSSPRRAKAAPDSSETASDLEKKLRSG